jgi:hypothetical protein
MAVRVLRTICGKASDWIDARHDVHVLGRAGDDAQSDQGAAADDH